MTLTFPFRFRTLILAAGLIFLLPFAVLKTASAEEPTHRFVPGEVLSYSLRWGAINVGRGTLEVRPMTEVDGVPAYHFVLSVRTNSWADVFYRVRSRFESFVTADLSRSLLYISNQSEGGRERQGRTHFEWDEDFKTAIVRTYNTENELTDEIEVEGNVFDPLGMMYVVRQGLIYPGMRFNVRATDGSRMIDVEVDVKKVERIRVPFGRFQTTLVEPETKELRGVFARSRDSSIQIWYSSDEHQFPVQLRGDVAVGSFRARLRGLNEGGEVEDFEEDPD